MTDPLPNPSLRELLNGISSDVQLLAAHTVALARLEVAAAASKVAWSGFGVLASVFVAAVGATVLVSALVLILVAFGLPPWAASILVGVVLTICGALSVVHFTSAIRNTELSLKETRQSVSETLEWLRLQTRS
jgi:hypothetical protein